MADLSIGQPGCVTSGFLGGNDVGSQKPGSEREVGKWRFFSFPILAGDFYPHYCHEKEKAKEWGGKNKMVMADGGLGGFGFAGNDGFSFKSAVLGFRWEKIFN
jgi:hypothetical protein